jgi:hypothetical protein
MTDSVDKPIRSEIVLYQTEDGKARLEVRLENETVWLTQNQMAELFQTSIPNVSMHIRNIFREGELQEDSVVKDPLTTAADGKRYRTNYFNLDIIISVGYRVKSHRGTQFRIWATQRLREYVIRGSSWMTSVSNRPGAATISINCWPASGIFAPRKKSSGARCWRSTPAASTTIPIPTCRGNSSRRCKTRCTGQPTATRPPRSLRPAPMPRIRAWG